MSTKYSVSPTERWRLQSETRPRFTEHSLERFDERTPEWAHSPEHAYLEGIPLHGVLDLLTDKGGQTPERARLYAESKSPSEYYGVVLIIRNNHVMTVLSLSGFEDKALQAYLEVLAIEEELV